MVASIASVQWFYPTLTTPIHSFLAVLSPIAVQFQRHVEAVRASCCKHTINSVTGGFSAASSRLWNDLPPGLWRPGLIFDYFTQSLKSHLLTGGFTAAGSRLRNDLPPGLRRPGLTFDSFRQSQKTRLFGDQSA